MQELLSHGPGVSAESAHDAIKADDSLWTALAFHGIQHDERGNLTENRRCPSCGSVLARPLSMQQASEVYEEQAELQARSKAALEAARRLLRLPAKQDSDEVLPQSSDELEAEPRDHAPKPEDTSLPEPSGIHPPEPSEQPLPQLVVISLRIEGTVQLPSPVKILKPDAPPAKEEPEPSFSPPAWSPDDGWPRTAPEFGLALRQTREFIGLTRAELSEMSMVADSTIRNVETNRHNPTATMRRKLIQALALRGYPRPVGK